MTSLRYVIVFGLLWLFSMPVQLARATPPLTLTAQDQPLAVSETHLYVMRHIADNAGRYTIDRSKTYLVKLETGSSQLAEFHKLQEADQYIPEYAGAAPSTLSANEDFNLFAYLAQEKAFYTGSINPPPHRAISIEKKTDHYVLSRRLSPTDKEERSVIYKANLAALILASYKPLLSDYIGPIPDPVPNAEIYSVMQNLETLSGHVCSLDKVIEASQPLSKRDFRSAPKDYIAYIKCSSAGDTLHIQAALPLALTFSSKDTLSE